MNLYNRFSNHKKSIHLILSYFLLVIFAYLFYKYQFRLLNLIEWGDESETVVVTKMMAKGYRLYTEVYNNHGPLTFLPGYIISKFGNFPITIYRLPIIVLQWISLVSIYLNTSLKNNPIKRNYAIIIIGSIIAVFMPRIYGHTYIYQVLTGLFIIMIANLWVIPNLLNVSIHRVNVFIGTFLIICLPFFAITNLPLSLILWLISFRKKLWKPILSATFLGLIFNFIVLVSLGSLDGYIAYHFYLNYAILNDSKGLKQFVFTIYQYYTENFTNFLTMMFILMIVSTAMNKTIFSNKWRVFLLIPALVSLIIRGGNVYDLAGLVYLYSLIAFISIFFVEVDKTELSFIDESFQLSPILIAIGTSLILLFRPLSPSFSWFEFQTETEFSRIVSKITNEDDRILALTFRSYEYLVSDRLPASGQFIYLPIQGLYNQNPYHNILIDLAEDIQNYQPKIILMDRWSFLDRPEYAWDSYASDVNKVIEQYYYQLYNKPIYIRKDLDIGQFGLDPYTGEAY